MERIDSNEDEEERRTHVTDVHQGQRVKVHFCLDMAIIFNYDMPPKFAMHAFCQ